MCYVDFSPHKPPQIATLTLWKEGRPGSVGEHLLQRFRVIAPRKLAQHGPMLRPAVFSDRPVRPQIPEQPAPRRAARFEHHPGYTTTPHLRTRAGAANAADMLATSCR